MQWNRSWERRSGWCLAACVMMGTLVFGACASSTGDDGDPDGGPPDAAPQCSVEVCDGSDNDCNGVADFPGELIDGDGDGVPSCADCDDDDGDNYPGNVEVCDGRDNDCNGLADFPSELADGDGDGVLFCADCDDADASSFPGNPEVCDGRDNDCDGVVDSPAAAANADCDDGLYCTGVEICTAGVGCADGPDPVIDDGDPCTVDACNDSLDSVTHTPADPPPAPGVITGPASVSAGAAGLGYSIAPVADATRYDWTVPAGWAVTGGAGTPAIIVTAGANPGDICVTGSDACGTSLPTCLAVTIGSSGSKRVFVTSTQYDGNLGGLVGADVKCQDRANAASLGGTWKAWLSDGSTDVRDRLSHNAGPYVRLDGVQVAADWTDLVTNALGEALEVTELGAFIPYEPGGSVAGCSWAGGMFFFPWTASANAGTLVDSNSTCSNWTSTSGIGQVGLGGYSHSQWTNWCLGFACSTPQPLYCFEQ